MRSDMVKLHDMLLTVGVKMDWYFNAEREQYELRVHTNDSNFGLLMRIAPGFSVDEEYECVLHTLELYYKGK